MVQNDNLYCSDGDMLFVSTNQYVDAWTLDSRCSYHITHNKEWLSSYMSDNSGSVYLDDDRCCNIVGVCEVRIKMHDGTIRTLSDVRHIPDLKKNLISLGTLHKNDFISKTDEDRKTIRIVKGALTVMKEKITAGNVYKLLGNTIVGGVYSVNSCDDNMKLWHMILDHLSEMTELHKRNLLHGVKSCKLDFYKFCVLGKHTKVSFTTGEHKTEGILDYVHSDVWGPTKESSLGGSLDERSKLDPKSKQCIFLGYKKGAKSYKFWDLVARKMVISRDAVFDEQSMLQHHQDKMPQIGSNSNTLQMELKPHLVATENHGSTHPTSGDPVAIESGGNLHLTSGGSTTNELQAYNLARDR
ncbi:UNVERIFIED_CONTAM: Retrovirus-related Pol polyprotein from transposon TNT 1-94 [Sesamum angustifolium]|uniref:Retrovirus-related Pol polyprotein from transposon TNT 1-94 n=1 Tax=Sesamum angustifolium TaxID=2727405 RepID=A0AAW2IX66_9LAMI